MEACLKQKRWQIFLGLFISGLFLWTALRGLNFTAVWHNLHSANYIWVLPAFLGYFVTVGVRAWRWQILLKPLKSVPLVRLIEALIVGYLGNNIYPFRIGELLRVMTLRVRANVPVSTGLATLLVERVFDGMGILTIIFISLLIVPLPESRVRTLIWAATAVFAGTLIIFFILAALPKQAERFAYILSQYLPSEHWQERFMEVVGRFLLGLASLRNFRNVLLIYFMSVLIWFLETAKYWLVMQGFPFEVSFAVLMLTNGIVNLASSLPSAPGFVGTFDLPAIATLQLFGVNEETATAYTIVLHATLWLPSVIFGFAFLLYAGLNLTDFKQKAEVTENRMKDEQEIL